jgi:hypothetical protein
MCVVLGCQPGRYLGQHPPQDGLVVVVTKRLQLGAMQHGEALPRVE